MVRQPYKYYCVVDYEASGEEDPYNPGHGSKDFPSEIIQFPAVLINSYTNSIEDTFNRYVRPVNNPRLSMFIKNLTHISQKQVDNADTFIEVLDQFEKWLSKYSSKPFSDVCFVTDGNYDFDHYLKLQCRISGIPKPSYMKSYLNIKEYFKRYYNRPRYQNIQGMLLYLGMSFKGSNHNGLDDSLNIARIVQHMINTTLLEKNVNYYY